MRTVSNVVNGYVHVSAGTRERVEQAVAELGYRPNLVARNLARGRTGLVALVVPQLEMPYFASLAQQMLDAAEAMGLHLVVEQTHGSRERELAALEGGFGQRIDGIVLSPTTLDGDDIEARRSTLPLVLLGDRDWPDSVTSVAIDRLAAARAAVEHLLGTGRRRVAIVGTNLNASNARWQSWHDTLTAARCPVSSDLQFETTGISGDDGESAARRIVELQERPDAVFCVTDWIALGLIRGLQRAGLDVPDDIAVVGHDDIPYGRASNPTLTTISPNRAEIATIALQAVSDAQEGPQRQTVGWSLVVRESSAGHGGVANP